MFGIFRFYYLQMFEILMMLDPKQTGFTLIELLLVIAILLIFFTIAVPKYQSLRAKQELQDISDLIPNVLRLAKNEAFLRHQDIVVCPSLDQTSCFSSSMNEWKKYILLFVDVNQNRRKDANEQTIAVYPLHLNYATLHRSGARNANYIMFKRSNALPQGSQGSFSLCFAQDSHLNRRIVLNAMGHIRIDSIKDCAVSIE